MTGQREPVARALEVLNWLADHPKTPWSIRRVARDLETSPTTVHRIFGTFEASGLLRKDGDGGYLPSLGLYRMCRAIIGEDLPVELARPHLTALMEEVDETVMFGAYDPKRQQMMYLAVCLSRHPVQHIVVANEWRTIHAGAAGLGILAFLPEPERRSVYARGLERFTDKTIVNEDELEAMLATIRRAGYVRSRGQRRVGAGGIAAPVFDCLGNVFGDVCITIPDQRFDERLTKSRGTAAVAAADAITEQFRRAGFRRGFA